MVIGLENLPEVQVNSIMESWELKGYWPKEYSLKYIILQWNGPLMTIL